MAMALGAYQRFKGRASRCVKLLIDANLTENLAQPGIPCINVNLADRLGRTPLHIAVMHGMEEVVHFLLSNGAEPLAEDLDGATPLVYAVDFKRPVILKTLLDAFGVNILQIVDNQSNHLLIRAIQKSSWECLCLLLQYGGAALLD